MAELKRSIGVITATVRFILNVIHYLQRRRMTEQRRPHLQLDFIHPPYWGAEKLDFAITNSGGGRARDSRYCRLQEFTMAGPSGQARAFSARRWYGSDRLDVPPGGKGRCTAALTLSACPRGVLSDLVGPTGNEGAYRDAIVCRDAAGTLYRFQCHLGPDAHPDTWSAGPLDRFRGISPPPWAEWAKMTDPVDHVRWSDVK